MIESGISPELVARISQALESTPTAAYTAPHDYPHAAPIFQQAPMLERERVTADAMRLYIHIPFCNYACSFCCYAKKVGVSDEQKQRYVKALKRELEWIEPGTPVSQFFMGGGTPTALPAEMLDEVLEAIGERMPYAGGVHTVETSPESLTLEHLKVLKRRGVGRISMGIQSLREGVLDSVRRGHDARRALEACEMILGEGFILNIDLIYGLPDQDMGGFSEDFALASRVGVHAVTAYNLRLNEYTPVARNLEIAERFNLEKLMHWRAHIKQTAQSLGYTQTRWHTFKKLDSIAARHERLPVSGADLKGYQFGIGLSARSSLGHSVYRNHRGLSTYMTRVGSGQSPVEEVFHLKQDDLKTQYITRTLGDGKGLDFDDYGRTFSRSFEEDFGDTLTRLQSAGLLEADSKTMRLTETGKLVHDLITLSFYPEHAKRWLLEHLRDFQLDQNIIPLQAA